jgi:serine/threonine protein kinase
MDLGNYSIRSVVWSLGVILYEMYYGRLPNPKYLPTTPKAANLFPVDHFDP